MSNDDENLITDRQVRERLGGVSAMTVWRWERDPVLGFPPKIVINKRNYRRLGAVRAFEARQEQRSRETTA